MSTDDFTKAARKRAERRVPLDGGEPDLIFRDRRELVEMAEWARDYLAAQEDDGHNGWCGCGCQDAQEPGVQHLWRPGASPRAFCGDEAAQPWTPVTREESLAVPVCALCHQRAMHESYNQWAAQDPTDAEKPDPSVDYHAMWWKAEREREKAERERDEARDAASTALAAWEARERSRAAEPRPLTADDITDEMVQRLRDEERALGLAAVSSEEVARSLLVAALTEPPARPEGAEEWEDWLIEALPRESMPDEDIARLADRIAARTARRDEEKRNG